MSETPEQSADLVPAHLASPVDRVKRPRVSDESPRLGLDRTEARAFLTAADAASARDALLARMLVTNGLRVFEDCSANLDDFDHERGHQVLRVTGRQEGHNPARRWHRRSPEDGASGQNVRTASPG